MLPLPLPDLPRTYVEHVVSPYGMGDLCDPNAAGEVGSMVGGLGVRVSIRYACTEDNGTRIEDACGRAFGGQAAIAPLSWLLSKLRGCTWEEACRLTHEDVLEALSDGDRNGVSRLPAAVTRSAEFAVRAMRRALGIADHGMPANLQGDGVLVCRCLGVGDRRIRQAFDAGAPDVDALGESCGAGTGCGSCRPDLLALMEEQRGTPPPPPDEALHPVVRITHARAGPLLRALGLPLLSVRIEDEVVHIGTGVALPGALLTTRSAPAVVRQILRETVCDEIRVVHEQEAV